MPCVHALTLTFVEGADLLGFFEQELSKGRAFVPGATGVSEFDACELVLDCAGGTHTLRAEAVFVKAEGPGCGVGLQLAPLDAAAMAELHAFVSGAISDESPTQPAIQPTEGGADPMQDGGADPMQDALESTQDALEPKQEKGGAPTLHERIRSLSPVAQQRTAVGGTLPERVVLERLFGPNVWEALLSNPRLTIPEVATIARKGTVPRPLIESLASHPSWLAAPEVQRALLSNPRSTPMVVNKVLRTMARNDLLLVQRQSAYPHAVRAAAKKMLG
ncbi:MAG TPA: hypothetical protein VGY54_21160 [Polyangiaceae bacterium]|nr:hypothetical protein [Polyangiaceae bacterium]